MRILPWTAATAGVVCLIGSTAWCLMALQFNAAIYEELRPSIVRVSCQDRAATGFVWSSSDTAITALHAVTGCGNVNVYYEAQKVSRTASVVKILRRADLAMLRINGGPSSPALQIDVRAPALTEQLSTLGFPLQQPTMSSTSLQLRFGGKQLKDIVPESVAKTLSGGSPSLELEIDNIEGHLLPGHSGAPVFNSERKVVAIADGGLANGAAAISWAIPAKFLNELSASNENPAVGQQSGRNAVLFSAETEAKNMGEVSCSGQELTKVRSTSFTQASASADDPRGLFQLVQFFGVDASGFMFDVYQHLTSGATFVLPAGTQLRPAARGDCMASLPSGKVEMLLQLGILGSSGEAQATSQRFEQMLAGNTPQQWRADPQWTYMMPYPRFDGMVVRRRAYMHFTMMPYMLQDKYLFETLALRNNVFIGSAAMYAAPAQMQQRIAGCRLTPTASYCSDIREFFRDWVSAVLAIQLTTFPVG